MARYRPFPKNFEGKLDKEKVREQYLAGPHYSWSKFCATHNYNPDLRREFPIVEWHAAWKDKTLAAQAELLAESALALRSDVMLARAHTIRAQVEANIGLRKLYTKTLQDTEAQALPVNPRELLTLATAQRMIQKCEFDALLMTAQVVHDPIDPDASHITVGEDVEGERLRSIPISLMSGEALTESKMQEILDKWIDQSPARDGSYAESKSEPADDLNEPLPPTEVESDDSLSDFL